MQELPNDKNLLKNERVIQAYWGLMGVTGNHFTHKDTFPSPADVAFEMMAKCVVLGIGDFVCLNIPTAKEIIAKAVLAWEESQK